jgi:hypothetical protein
MLIQLAGGEVTGTDEAKELVATELEEGVGEPQAEKLAGWPDAGQNCNMGVDAGAIPVVINNSRNQFPILLQPDCLAAACIAHRTALLRHPSANSFQLLGDYPFQNKLPSS